VKTHLYQLHQDVAAIDAALPADNFANHAERAGRLDALATYYANCADNEAAQRERLKRDPKALVAAFFDQIGGPSAADIGVLLREVHQCLRLRPELIDAMGYVEEAAACAEFEAEEAAERAEEAAERERLTQQERRDSLIGRGLLTC
jgi:hypothetical protein